MNLKRWNQVGQVQITFTNKQLTAWGGACSTVAKFLEQLSFREWVEQNVLVEEHSPNAKGIYPKVLALILTSLVGGTRFSDLNGWMHGRDVMAKCFGVDWRPRASSVLTRFISKFTRRHCEHLRAACVRLCVKLLELEGIGEADINFDSSVLTRYGQQEGALKGYNPKKPRRPSHHPLQATLDNGYLVNQWNRSGNTHTAHQIIFFFEQTIAGLPTFLRNRRILADCGYCTEEFLNYLEARGHTYIIAVPMSEYVTRAILQTATWTTVAEGIEMAGVRVRLSTWKRERRMVFVRQHVPTRPTATGKQPTLFADLEDHRNYRYGAMVTNDNTLSTLDTWRTYRPRAKIENVIQELKGGYGWDEFNVRSFFGTEAVMHLIGMVAYNLIHFLNRVIFKTASEPLSRLKKIRMKVLAIPAVYGSSGRTPTLRLGVADRKIKGKITYWLRQINELPLCLVNCNAIGPPTQE